VGRGQRTKRNQAVETLRIVCAYGIVQFHAHAGEWHFAYTGLIVFIVLSPMIDVLINWDRIRSPAALARSLLVPWAFWMIVYGAVNLALHKPLLPSGYTFGSTLIGTSGHLWFMPFIFGVLVILNALKSTTTPLALFWSSAIAATALMATAFLWRPVSLDWRVPLNQWIYAAPPALAGIALGCAGRSGKAGTAGLALVATGLIAAIFEQLPGIGVQYTLGITASAIAVLTGDKWFPRSISVQPIADCMPGVYLVHLLALAVGSKLLGHGTIASVVFAFLLSLGAVWLARRYAPVSRRVLG
jgi:hypothetical protein